MDVVVPFEDLTRASHEWVGGKAASLGALTRLGMPVPEGFVIPVEVFRRALEWAGLVPLVDALSAAPDAAARRNLAAMARDRLAGVTLSDDVRRRLAEAYADLGGGAVAVRSSATTEDLADASFAGQHATFLNVSGLDALFDAVRRCWASLYADRAVHYRLQRGIPESAAAMAVIVQRMVSADAAGVIFTANPVTGSHEELVLNAVRGLGDRLVSGEATPEQWVIDRQTMLSIRTATRSGTPSNSAATAPPGTSSQEEERCLSEHQVQRIASAALEIERSFEAPQDIEWAIAGDVLYVLQSRPITGLPAHADARDFPASRVQSAPSGQTAGASCWIRSLGPFFDRPLPPLLASLFVEALNRLAAVEPAVRWFSQPSGADPFRSFDCYLYERIDATPLPVETGPRRPWPSFSEAYLASQLERWMAIPADAIAPGSTMAAIEGLVDAILRYWLSVGRPGAVRSAWNVIHSRAAVEGRPAPSASPLLARAWAQLDWLIDWLARELLAAGVLEYPRDLRFISLAQLRELLLAAGLSGDSAVRRSAERAARSPGNATPTGRATPDVVRRKLAQEAALRRAEFDRWSGEIAPLVLPRACDLRADRNALARLTIALLAPRRRILRGDGVSPGRAGGPAILLDSPCNGSAVAGAVVVATEITPAWSPVLLRAAAVISEREDLNSVAAAVAREFGVPAVFGVDRARQSIRPGDQVMVDGFAGLVVFERTEDVT